MGNRSIVFSIVLVACAGLAGFLYREVQGLQHVAAAHWVAVSAYLIGVPLAKLVVFSPGLVVGFLCNRLHLVLVFLLGCLAYFPFQYFSGASLSAPALTLAGQSLAYAVAVAVAYLAGSRLSRG